MTDEELISKYERFVWKTARRMQRSYALTREDYQDIVSSCYLMLCAMKDEVRESPWYVFQSIVNCCINALKVARKHRVVEYVAPVHDEEEQQLDLPDERVNVECSVVHKDRLERCLSLLKGRELAVFQLYMTGMKQREIGAALELSPQRVYQLLKSVSVRLRRAYATASSNS